MHHVDENICKFTYENILIINKSQSFSIETHSRGELFWPLSKDICEKAQHTFLFQG